MSDGFRSLFALLTGLAIYSVPSVLILSLTGADIAMQPDWRLVVPVSLVRAFFALLGGYASAEIAGKQLRIHGGILAFLIVIGSLAAALVWDRPSWNHMLAIAVMAPAALAGSQLKLWMRARTMRE